MVTPGAAEIYDDGYIREESWEEKVAGKSNGVDVE